MRYRTLSLAVLLAAAALHIAGQAKSASAAKPYTPPKTPWGDPDLQGVWPGTDLNNIPLQRPASFGERSTLTDQEFQQREAFLKRQDEIDTAEFASKNPLIAGANGTFVTCEQDPQRCRDGVRIGPPNYWDERGKPSRQASLVVDPPNGRIPALTAEAQQRQAARAAANRARSCFGTTAGCHDSWLDESMWDRCITRGTVGSMVNGGYNRGNDIVQSPGYVVLRNEMIHEARIIPVDRRPVDRRPLDGRHHLSSSIRSYAGDSRGHWEGNTLVVETTNFVAGNAPIAGAPTSDALRLIERFTRTGPDTLNYELTVEDPKTWTAPWKVAFPLPRDSSYTVFEYACHEGNYYMFNALIGARKDEEKVRTGK